jgi:hypothetical protein
LIFGSPLPIFIIVLCDSLKKERKKIMETVIIVSVLSTLCAVALVGSIVVLYRRSKNKVDVVELNEYRREIDERLSRMSDQFSNDIQNIYRHTDEREREVRNDIDATKSMVDSRCDKLHSMIQPDAPKKQILKS